MTDQYTDPRRDPAWIEAATDDYEDTAFYDTLDRRYESYTGPLSFQQYLERAEAERTNIELGLNEPLPYDDIIRNADDAAGDDAAADGWAL